MTRLVRDPRRAALTDSRLLTLGVLLGLGALTRNETVWLALIWAGLVWFTVGRPASDRLRMIGVVAVVALAVFAPWAYRNLVVLGSPLPGQAVTNALYLSGFDIFAWNDPPTLARHLAIGPAALIDLRIAGLTHNLFNVLVILGIPVSLIGLVALPWHGRGLVLRPLLWISLIMFFVTSLLFPAATQWGTFLHAAAPVHVLIVISAAFALDAGIARLGRRMGWTNPIAWLGTAVGLGSSLLFSVALLPTFGGGSHATQDMYAELGARMAAIGRPLDRTAGPVITNFPIWMAEVQRIPSLALPDEPPEDILDLARTFPGTRLMVLISPEGKHWPADIEAGLPGSECFQPVDLGPPTAGHRRGRPPRGRRGLRDRLPMSGPYTPKPMEAAGGATDARDSRFEGLHAEASAAVGYSANTIRQVRERYRQAYAEALTGWQELRDDLDGIDRTPGAGRAQGGAADPAGPVDGDGPDAINDGARDAQQRSLRGEVATRGRRSSRSTDRPSPGSSSPSARSRERGCSLSAATAPSWPLATNRVRAKTSRCASSRPRRPSALAWPRTSTTARSRRCRMRSSRPTTPNA